MSDADRSTILDEATCRQLLGAARLGRIAFNADPSPTILPVNYALHDDAVVFRTVEGSKLAAAQAGVAASFEVDGVYPDHDSGWSVLVRGHLEEVDDPDGGLGEVADALRPVVGGDRPHLVRLSIGEITGRQIRADQAFVEAHAETNTWQDRDASDLLG